MNEDFIKLDTLSKESIQLYYRAQLEVLSMLVRSCNKRSVPLSKINNLISQTSLLFELYK